MAGLRFRLSITIGILLAGWAYGSQDCPRLVGSFNTPAGTACGMTLAKNLAYIPEGSDVFQILDVGDTARIKALWTHSWSSLCTTQTLLEGSALAGRILYITFRCLPDASSTPGPSGLLILDVSNPNAPVEHPRMEYSLPATGGFTSVVVAGTTAYVASGTQGLYLFDITDPLNPVFLSQLDTDGYAEALAVIPGNVFLVDRSLYGGSGGGVVVVNTANPKAPRRVGSFIGARDPRRIVIVGSRAYVSDSGAPSDGSDAGLWALDISNPAAMVVLGSYISSMQGLGLAVDGKLAYLGMNSEDGKSSAIQAIGVAVPEQMFNAGLFQNFGSSSGISRNSSTIFWGAGHALKAFSGSDCEVSRHGRPVTKP